MLLSTQSRKDQRPVLAEIPKHTGETAWIFGAGASINYIKDWNIPDNVTAIAVNGGFLACAEKKVDYWFCIDHKVFAEKYMPAILTHPTVKKIIGNFLQFPFKTENLYYAEMPYDWQGLDSYKKNRGKLMRGNTVLITALCFCHLAGFKNVILSGCDFCRLDNRWHFWDEPHQGHNHGKRTIAPNGEWVYQPGEMTSHMTQCLRLIGEIQDRGVFVCKTLDRGMAPIPYILNESDIAKIAGGCQIRVEPLDKSESIK